MSLSPIISCVIPVYNDETMVIAAIKSAINQDISKEIIVINDASTDNSTSVISDFIQNYDYIRLISLPQNMGLGFARNFGAAFANGKYLTFLDSDDEHLPNFYASFANALEENSQIACIDGKIEYYGALKNSDFAKDDPRVEIASNTSMINKVMRKSVFNAIGGFPTTKDFRGKFGGEDAAFVQVLKTAFITASADVFVAKSLVKPHGHFVKYINSTHFDNGKVIYEELQERNETNNSVEIYANQTFESMANLLKCFNTQAFAK